MEIRIEWSVSAESHPCDIGLEGLTDVLSTCSPECFPRLFEGEAAKLRQSSSLCYRVLVDPVIYYIFQTRNEQGCEQDSTESRLDSGKSEKSEQPSRMWPGLNHRPSGAPGGCTGVG